MHVNDKKALLEGLGTTDYRIGQELVVRGIKGRMVEAAYCPLANYIKSVDPNTTVVSVSSIRIFWGSDTIYPSPAQMSFIRNFDNGAFPELVAQPSI